MTRFKKSYLFLFIILGVVFCLSIYYFNEKSPSTMIEKKFNFNLPVSSTIMNYEYIREDDYFGAKILIDDKSLNEIKESLNKYFKEEHGIQDDNDFHNIENIFSWWDIDKSSIVVSYMTVVGNDESWFKSMSKSRTAWAFITRSHEGQYYLYLIH